jgi:RNA recognition motif-containing protein
MNIYISNLDTTLTDADLANLFSPYGEVQSATIALDGFTAKSRGFGYVDMPDYSAATAAITELHNSEINGLHIMVKEMDSKQVHRGSYKVGDPSVKGYEFRKI